MCQGSQLSAHNRPFCSLYPLVLRRAQKGRRASRCISSGGMEALRNKVSHESSVSHGRVFERGSTLLFDTWIKHQANKKHHPKNCTIKPMSIVTAPVVTGCVWIRTDHFRQPRPQTTNRRSSDDKKHGRSVQPGPASHLAVGQNLTLQIRRICSF